VQEIKLYTKEEALKLFPSILYKYRDWNNEYHKKIITDYELYMPLSHQLNDIYDGQLYEIINNQKITTHETGVFSLCEEANNNVMWSHYGNSHKGFCIGFNVAELFNILKDASLGKVSYRGEFPSINDIHNLNFIKSKEWEYEKEYRFKKIKLDNSLKNNDFGNQLKKGALKELDISIDGINNYFNSFPSDHIFKLTNKSINEIIFGWNASSEDINEIWCLVNKNFENVKFYKIDRDKQEFKLNIKPI
jgi:hypothetical protein